MVSTTAHQYITDAPPTSSSEGKNPLALLAKTCETIGLPDNNTNSAEKRRTPEKKESSAASNASSDVKKSPESTEKKRISPRATPTTSKAEPITSTTTFPGLPKPAGFPMGFPGMMPFYHPSAAGMMPFSMPSFFPMAPFMARPPCPSALMRTPCVTPGCTSCSPEMAAFAAAAATNPLFSAYAAMMPTSSAASTMPTYQQLLATVAATSAAKHTCSWMESTGLCGKQFSSAEELASHMKSTHAPSPPSAATTPETKTPHRSSTSSAAARFHPYAKTTPLPPMPMANPFSPLAMQQAMFAQRMMGMPHP